MPFKITIIEIKPVTETKRGEYVILDRRPWTPEEINDKIVNAYRHAGGEAFLSKEPLKEVRGYAPDREVTSQQERKVFEQELEAIELGAVIKAVNNL